MSNLPAVPCDSPRAILPINPAPAEPRIHCGFEIVRPSRCDFRYFDPGDAAGDLGSGEHHVIRDSLGGTVILTTRPLDSRGACP